jgi:hypothetical protein
MRHRTLCGAALTFSLALLAGCHGQGQMYAGRDGDYYVPPFGPPQRIVGWKLVPLELTPQIEKTLVFSQDLGTDPVTHFHVRASGAVRLQGSVRKIHLQLQLSPSGAIVPPVEAQQAFVDSLADSTALQDQIVLYFTDRHGMKAAEPRSIPLASPDGAEVAGTAEPNGAGPSYDVDILEPWSPPTDGDVSSVIVGWRDKNIVPGASLPAAPASPPNRVQRSHH